MAECGVMQPNFFEILASAVKKDPVSGKFFLSVQFLSVACEDAIAAVDCGEDLTNPEAFVVGKIFDVDDCGNVIMNIGSEPAAL